MPRINRQAGQNIRELAFRRRVKAISSFILAGFIIGTPFFLIKTFDKFLKQISSGNQSQVQPAFNFPVIVYIPFILMALLLTIDGALTWQKANNADQGAEGEEDVAQAITNLEARGWQIEYGLALGNRLGDLDIFCVSPNGKAFAIDVKSHRGEVITDGKDLYRRMGNKKYPFEKNFVQQAMRQALQIKKQKDLLFVTPMVVFSTARVSIQGDKLGNVYVVEKVKLVSLLESLG